MRLIFDAERMQQRLDAIGDISPPKRDVLPKAPQGPTLPPVEERVAKLETHMEYVRKDLDEIKSDLKSLVTSVSTLPTKTDLNTWRWQWLAMGIAIITLTVGGITGGLALIAHYAG